MGFPRDFSCKDKTKTKAKHLHLYSRKWWGGARGPPRSGTRGGAGLYFTCLPPYSSGRMGPTHCFLLSWSVDKGSSQSVTGCEFLRTAAVSFGTMCGDKVSSTSPAWLGNIHSHLLRGTWEFFLVYGPASHTLHSAEKKDKDSEVSPTSPQFTLLCLPQLSFPRGKCVITKAKSTTTIITAIQEWAGHSLAMAKAFIN